MRKVFASLILCSSLLLTFAILCTATNENEVSSKISEAENAVKNAFTTLWKAEKVGVNVSSLVAELNGAGGLLAEAEIAYKNGDLDEALSKAGQCLATANSVMDDATILNNSAEAQRIFWLTLTFSLAGAFHFYNRFVNFWLNVTV